MSKILTYGSATAASRPALGLYGKVGFMIALPSTMKWLGSGLGIWAALACSAEASSPPPQQGTGNAPSTSGGGGSTGTSPLPTAGTLSTGTGGATPLPVVTAGTTSVGTAGTSSGGMMGGSLAACPSPPAAGTMADLLIDDLEDGDNGIHKDTPGTRTGFWYTYGDALGSTIIPKPDPAGTSPLKPGTTMCHGGTMCVLISGTTAMADEMAMKYPYAGVGFDFSNAKKPCVYNASAYKGIKFWARGDVPITIKLNTTATATADGGGTCTGTMCNGGFSPAGADVLLSTTWTEVDINFETAAPPSWAATLALHPDKAALLSLQVQIPPGQTFNVALDDFTFY